MGIDFLDLILSGNSVRNWGIAFGTAIATFLLLWLLRAVLRRGLDRISGRTRNYMDDLAAQAVQAIRLWLVVAVSLGVGAQGLALHPRVAWVIQNGTILLLLVQVGISGVAVIRAHVSGYTSRHIDRDAGSISTVRAVGFLTTVVLWVVLCLVALDNFGVEVTALVAGLGIGGIAVALAVQNILGDLFASLSIVIDKPFEVGDFVVVGDFSGSVEQIGVKTTRIRSLSGEQIVFPNGDLLQSRLRNYKRMYERRVVFRFGVLYETPVDQLEAIAPLVRDIVEALETVRFDRAHLFSFGPSSLDFEVVYWVKSADYNLYADRHQAINLALLRALAERGIGFAYPTQTVHVASLPVDAGDDGDDAGAAEKPRRVAS